MRRAGVLIAVLTTLAAACSSGSTSSESGSTPTAPVQTVRVLNQNLLHGTACPADSNRCALSTRVALFHQQLVAARCPELVAIEEANRRTVTELKRHVPGKCGYHLVSDNDPGQDREIVLSALPVLASERRRLAGPLRTAYWVRVASAAGPVDLVATHLASSSDDRPCDSSTCPPPCEISDTLNTCQGRQAVEFLDEKRGPRSVGVLAGDINAQPDEPTIVAIESGGLSDTHRVIGNPECNPATGTNCTSGRVDDSLVDLSTTTNHQSERIDYIFLATRRSCRVVRPTGVFAGRGGTLNSIAFPSDHSGVIATIRCRTTAADLAASKPVPTTTTTSGGVQVTSEIEAAVTQAFTTLFAPNPNPDAQLATLENAAALRDSFIARKQQVGALADRTSVRIDSFTGTTDKTVDVTFSIMIDGNVVLDALPGQAKLVDGHWLVTAKTYCQVATLGIDTIPEACRT